MLSRYNPTTVFQRIKAIHTIFRHRLYYGWVVAGASFFISVIGLGARFSFGVFLTSLETEFNISRGVSSAVFSVYMLLCCLIAALGGWALDRWGPRKVGLWMAAFTGLAFFLTGRINAAWQLWLTYSLVLSLGTGTIFTVANSTTSRWFVKKRGLAVGLSSSGGGVGVIVIAPLAAFLISRYSWRTAFSVIGWIAWIGMAAGALLLIKDPQKIGLAPDGAAVPAGRLPDISPGDRPAVDIHLRQALRIPSFWFLLMIWFTLSLALHMIFVHVVPYAVALGVAPMDAAFIISLMGLTNIAGRLAIGRLSDRVGRKILGVGCIFCQFLALLWLMRADRLWMFYLFAVFFGLLWGGAGTMMTVLIGDTFGVLHLGAIMGIMSAAWAAGAAVGPAVAGYIYDLNSNYMVAFGAGAAALLASTGFMALVRHPRTT